jgi:hypothetical protein
MRKKLFAVAGLALLASATFASYAGAADHRDSPSNVANPTADINDVYAFRSPTNANNLVVAISANPLIVPSDNAKRGVFDPAVQFKINVDGNGDLSPDAVVNIRRAGDTLVFEGLGDPIAAQITAPGQAPVINTAGPVKAFAGLRDDPFFFDLAGFQAFVANPQAPVNGLRAAGGGAPVDQPPRQPHRPHGDPGDQHSPDPVGPEGRLQRGRPDQRRRELPRHGREHNQHAPRRSRQAVRAEAPGRRPSG